MPESGVKKVHVAAFNFGEVTEGEIYWALLMTEQTRV